MGFAFAIYVTGFIFKHVLKNKVAHVRFAFVIYVTSFVLKDILKQNSM